MRITSLTLATVFSVVFAATAQAQLRHVEMKTLGMD